ncbi:hypothetical protein F5Y10DRAFT_285736 [Nemania abortiva]|nr:hypothetical protein F5Y10DRAFT_285736 [Nemania abortiva]
MCGSLLYVSVTCDCLFCALAHIFDSKDAAENYPHFGKMMTGDARHYTYTEAVDPCDTIVLDAQGHWQSCDNTPSTSEDVVRWCGREGAGYGYRLCDDCELICRPRWRDEYSLEIPHRVQVMPEEKEGDGAGTGDTQGGSANDNAGASEGQS